MTIAELIIDSSKKAINFQTNEGLMPQGHNGPYNDNETPVRNTVKHSSRVAPDAQCTGCDG